MTAAMAVPALVGALVALVVPAALMVVAPQWVAVVVVLAVPPPSVARAGLAPQAAQTAVTRATGRTLEVPAALMAVNRRALRPVRFW